MAYPGYGYGGDYPGFPGGYHGAMQQDPLYHHFSAVVGEDQQIDANKLQGYLSSSGFFGSYYLFSLETCRLMISMLNRVFSGKIGFNEFKGLLILLRQWEGLFMECGHDQSETLGPLELQAAMANFGYGSSPNILNNFLKRYSTNDRISFDGFVACCVHLKSLKDQPEFTKHPQSQTLVQGSHATFSSDANGVPEPTFSWTKNGSAVTANDRISLSADNKHLSITNVNRTDSGEYRCVAANSVGAVSSNSATLAVHYQLEFTEHPLSQTLVQGSRVTFLSDANGVPEPTFSWTKNGSAVTANDRISLSADKKQLSITNVNRTDGGEYECVATNNLETVNSNPATLTVQESMAEAPGKWSEEPISKEDNRSLNLIVECRQEEPGKTVVELRCSGNGFTDSGWKDFSKKSVEQGCMAIKEALEVSGRQVAGVRPSESVVVELHCYTRQSFVSLMDDFESGKVKRRLEEEFEKVGYKGELEVTIINGSDVYRALDQIRAWMAMSKREGEISAAADDNKIINMACSTTSYASTKETTNFARLCRLIVDVGSHALRNIFDSIHPPAGLHVFLTASQTILRTFRAKRILTATQWGKLYPSLPSSVSSKDFDITLLNLLLRNICCLIPPITGWDNLPPSADTSAEANIARFNYYRNHVYGNASQASVDDATFNTYWQDISSALVRLGADAAAINTLKTQSMDPVIEKHYRELLRECKKDDDSSKDSLDEIEDNKIINMASSTTSYASTKETTNFARLCRLIVDVGSHALRNKFDSIHPPAGLHVVLTTSHTILHSLRRKRLLKATQWGKLYPSSPSSVSSKDFDITLLMLLLRNICSLTPPATGWDNLPPAADTSAEANIARVKFYRNHVYGNASQASVDDATFNTYWQDISNALVGLGADAAAINTLKTQSMDPVIEKHYQELLRECKKDDDSSKDRLDEIRELLKHVEGERKIIESLTDHEGEAKQEKAPSEILARGRLAIEAYRRALLEGKGSARRVPVMIIGQARTGKTSLKRSLKGELFNPNEGSTKGIETDPSYFKASTHIWRTGHTSEDTESEPKFLLDHQVARKICESLRKGDRLGDASTSGTKPSVNDSKVVKQIEANSLPTERSEETSSSTIEHSLQDSKVVEKAKPYSLRTEDLSSSRTELSLHGSKVSEKAQTSSSRTEQSWSDPSLQDSKDHLSVPQLPENVAVLVQNLLERSQEFEDEDHIYSIIWDFGGQSVYYATHPIFLTKQAIYILACDLSRDPDQKAKAPTKKGMYENKIDTHSKKTNLDYLDFWMTSVYSLVSPSTNRQETLSPEMLPAVFLACTHADKPYKNKANPKELAEKIFATLKDKIYGDLLKDVFVVDNTKSGSNDECQDVKNLRETVLSVAKELPQIKKAIPLKWLKYEKVLRLLSKEGYSWIPIEHARQIASDECGIDDDEQFRTLLNFLHDQRILIHFSETTNLDKMVILSPQWLIDIFKEVITVKHFKQTDKRVARLWRDFEKTGILDETLLNHAWRPLSDNRETYESLIAIMEKFSLLCAWPSDGTTQKYLVPSMLMSPPTDDVLKHLDCVRTPSLFVVFESGRVPPGLFSRLVLQFHWLCQKEWTSEINPDLFNNFGMFHILPERAISVVFMLHSSSIEIVYHDGKDARDLNTSRTIYSQLKCLLEHIRKEFFWLKHAKYKMCVCCPVCSQEGGIKCRDHSRRGCECVHFLSESELRERQHCNESGIFGDRTITITMFEHWFSFSDSQQSNIPLTQQQDVTQRDNSEEHRITPKKETTSERSTPVPPEVIINLLKKQDLPQSVTHLDDCQLPVDILLLTVEDCECLSCLSYLNPGFCKTFHRDLGFVYLGDMGKDERKLNIAVMSCHRGAVTPGGSVVVVLKGVNVLGPKAVFCVGSCRSLGYDKVKLGDIVMFEKLITTGPCRITEGGIEERGVKVPLKSRLLKVIPRAGDGWKPPLKDPKAPEVKIHRGTILSGPIEVIDSPKHCKALIDRFPEAVAMDEEGEGVFAAAHDLGIEWIVIKGISDYAGGSKSKESSWRPFASLMAASVTAHILSDAIIFQDWPHFESTSVEKSRMKRDARIPWGRWFDETNIKVVFAGLVGLIAVVLFFCFGSN